MSKVITLSFLIAIVLLFLFSVQSVSSSEFNNPEYQPGVLIICFRPEVANNSELMEGIAMELHNGIGSTVLENSSELGIIGAQLVSLAPNISVDDAMQYYLSNESILWAEPNYIIHIPEPGHDSTFISQRTRVSSLSAIPNDPLFSQQWGLQKIQAPQAWDITTGSNNVIIAVIDTGIDFSNSDFNGKIWVNHGEIPGNGIDDDQNGFIDDVNGWDFVYNDNRASDDFGHGTAVSSIIAANGNNGIGLAGMMWNVQIMPIKAADRNGFLYITNEVKAINYARENGAKIIQCSWGGYMYSNQQRDAIAQSPNQLFVCAAGNDGLNNDVNPQYPASYPENNIISVAATDRNDYLVHSWWSSNYGQNSVDVGAPGTEILVYGLGQNNPQSEDGTSFAAPHVAGLAGLILSKIPNLTPVEVRSFIMNNVDGGTLTGYVKSSGRINAYKTLQAVTRPPPPVANFTASPVTGPSPLTVHFTDTSSGNPTSWYWTFGDGSFSSDQNPVHQYRNQGTYSVSLKVASGSGSYKIQRSNYILVTSPPPVLPEADFTASPTSGPVPLIVQFTDLSIGNPTSWSWNFGDGTTSSVQNPIHTYSTAGTNAVSLTVSNSNGSNTTIKDNFISVTIPVTIIPGADFSAGPTSGTVPLNVQFTDLSSGEPTSWSWNFGDGAASSLQNPVHIYSSNGTYSVSLTVSNINGSNTITKDNFISAFSPEMTIPEADFTASPTSGTIPLNVQFTDQSIGEPTSWSWNFGDGATSNQENPVHTYSTAGTYSVNLMVSNTNGSDSKVKTNYIMATGPIGGSPSADFAANVTSGPAPLNVQFIDLSSGNPTSWFWNFGDGNTSTLQNPIHQYESLGVYSVSLKVTFDRNSYRIQKPRYISVNSPSQIIVLPQADFTANVTSGSVPLNVHFTDLSTGNPTSWAWNFGDGAVSNQQNPIHTYSTTGTYSVSLTVSNPNGSSTNGKANFISVTTPISIPLVADFTASPTTGTAPLNVQFTDSSTGNPTFWSWNFGDGATSNQKNPVHTYSAAGTYTVGLTVSNANGSTTITKANFISVTSPETTVPAADFTASPMTGTAPLNVQFLDVSTGNPISWSWNFGDGTTSTQQNPVHIFSEPGTYTITLRVTFGRNSYRLIKPGYITVISS
jgi:PKD repeat protein